MQVQDIGPLILRQSTVANSLFLGEQPEQNPTTVGCIVSYLNRASGGVFEVNFGAQLGFVYSIERIYLDLKDATSFTVSLFLAGQGVSLPLYTEASPEVTGNVLFVNRPGLILLDRDRIVVSAVGGTGAHVGEVVFFPLAG